MVANCPEGTRATPALAEAWGTLALALVQGGTTGPKAAEVLRDSGLALQGWQLTHHTFSRGAICPWEPQSGSKRLERMDSEPAWLTSKARTRVFLSLTPHA